MENPVLQHMPYLEKPVLGGGGTSNWPSHFLDAPWSAKKTIELDADIAPVRPNHTHTQSPRFALDHFGGR